MKTTSHKLLYGKIRLDVHFSSSSILERPPPYLIEMSSDEANTAIYDFRSTELRLLKLPLFYLLRHIPDHLHHS
ncbi:hypothetical protein H5410_038002 [Solanum commersonii]|uniref:Uncharacterized protein n=1 Tax=Solanum commersonii TaxID=4109 RepID=A0A9J5Y9H6_SOLCO|nr:hypothetical protein H5410_038002 [Solanum commersonii]